MIRNLAALLVLALVALLGFPPPQDAHAGAGCAAYTYTLTNGTTADANQVMSNFNTIRNCANTTAAGSGANSDITSLTGLTTPLSTAQGGTGSAVGPVLRDYLAGMILSNDSGTPNTVLDISAGYATDSTNAVAINLGAFTKSTGGTWAAGSGSNGMGTGLTIANNTWYHVFAIINAGVADAYFDTSVTAANAPASTTAFRRIGSFKTATGTTNILAFTQDGDYVRWTANLLDVNATNPGTSAVSETLTVPPGVNVIAFGGIQLGGQAGAQNYALLSDLVATDTAATGSSSTVGGVGTAGGDFAGNWSTRTNTAQQIRVRISASDAGTVVALTTMGWVDTRGRYK